MTNTQIQLTHPAARIAGSPHQGSPHPVTNPATGETEAVAGWADVSLVDVAVRAANSAWPAWAATPTLERAGALRAIAAALRSDADRLAEVVTRETGKRLAEAHAEALFSAHYFEFFASAGSTVHEEHRVTPPRRYLVRRQPVGVVAAMSPWNFPLSIPARKIAAALAAGCPVILKPSELTPLSAHALIETCEEYLPTGTVNLLVGDGAQLSSALIDHPDVAAVTFTGSTQVGELVGVRAARSFTRATLELGGRAPFLVCSDAEIDTALDALLVAKFRNNGASCIAANNVFVHETLYPDLLEALIRRVQALRVGDPRDAATNLGPLLRNQDVKRLRNLLTQAHADGCRVWSGSQVPDHGSFLEPSVVEVRDSTQLWSEEIFGPVCAVRPYRDEDAVVTEVNAWKGGLGGYVISADPEHAISLAERLRIGIVGVNNGAPNTPEVPFGGFGHSGVGREGGIAGLLAFTEEQTIAVAR